MTTNNPRALSIHEMWTTILGATISKYCEDIKLINQKLTISVKAPAIKDELLKNKATIIKHVNSLINDDAVNDLEVKPA